jgi:hypothetical protein
VDYCINSNNLSFTPSAQPFAGFFLGENYMAGMKKGGSMNKKASAMAKPSMAKRMAKLRAMKKPKKRRA